MTSFFQQACAIVGQQQERFAAHRTGVCWSGLSLEPPKVETVEEVEARLVRQAEANRLFKESPRGRLYACIRELDALGFGDESYKLESLYRSQIADEREPLNVSAVGACLSILGKINHSSAREGVMALSEMLLSEAPVRWAA